MSAPNAAPTGAPTARPMRFRSGALAARELDAAEIPLLQALFDANPGYFQTVNGRNAHPDEAQAEFDEMPPASLGYTRRFFLGLFDARDALQGIAVVVSDLCAPRVWHITLYLLAASLHGSGTAHETYRAMEAWMQAQGAQWLRLCVVAGNGRGERFWQTCGFEQTCVRHGVDTGGRLNTLRVLFKPLAGGSLADYLSLVPRDRSDPPAA
jgi:GNAT superfamily N-acetyltransferase